MRHNPLPLLGLALVSALLVSGPALAAPDNTGPAAERGRTVRPNQPPYTFRPGPKAVTPDEVRHSMQPGSNPERMAPDRHPGWNDDRRPAPFRQNGERRQGPPRWNDERPSTLPSRHHYQPDPKERHMRSMRPARPDDNPGRYAHPFRGEQPTRLIMPQHPGSDGIPFRYR